MCELPRILQPSNARKRTREPWGVYPRRLGARELLDEGRRQDGWQGVGGIDPPLTRQAAIRLDAVSGLHVNPTPLLLSTLRLHLPLLLWGELSCVFRKEVRSTRLPGNKCGFTPTVSVM